MTERIVHFVDLQRQYHSLREEVLAAVDQVASQANFIGGQTLTEFEQSFAALHGDCHVIGVSNGTDALHLAMLALEVGPGDEVITVPNTWISTAFSANYVGAKPVFVDIDPVTYQMDPAKLEAAITPRTKVVVPVHLYGYPAPMDTIVEICHSRGIKVVEDVAQAPLARLNGQLVGTFSDIACFSYYPSKNLGAYGHGGAVLTRDAGLATRVRELALYGQSTHHHHTSFGHNFSLDTLQAAILLVKIPYLQEWTQARRQVAKRYGELLEKLPVKYPQALAGAEPVYHLYVIELDDRDQALAYLREHGVMAQLHYSDLIHRQPCYASLGYSDGDFPHAERAAQRILSLPMFPEMTNDEIKYVVATLQQFLVSRNG